MLPELWLGQFYFSSPWSPFLIIFHIAPFPTPSISPFNSFPTVVSSFMILLNSSLRHFLGLCPFSLLLPYILLLFPTVLLPFVCIWRFAINFFEYRFKFRLCVLGWGLEFRSPILEWLTFRIWKLTDVQM